jgi:hypothetical protein
MNKRLLRVLLALSFLVAACSQNALNKPQVLVEFEKVKQKTLLDENNEAPIVRSDLDTLYAMVKNDELAAHYMDELYWMVDNGEKDHLGHTMDFLGHYLETGEKSRCTPHELWHATIYLKHGEMERVEHAVEDASHSYAAWVADNEEKRKKFPQFYLRFDEQKQEVAELVEQLQQGNYGEEIVQRIDILGDTAIC